MECFFFFFFFFHFFDSFLLVANFGQNSLKITFLAKISDFWPKNFQKYEIYQQLEKKKKKKKKKKKEKKRKKKKRSLDTCI